MLPVVGISRIGRWHDTLQTGSICLPRWPRKPFLHRDLPFPIAMRSDCCTSHFLGRRHQVGLLQSLRFSKVGERASGAVTARSVYGMTLNRLTTEQGKQIICKPNLDSQCASLQRFQQNMNIQVVKASRRPYKKPRQRSIDERQASLD